MQDNTIVYVRNRKNTPVGVTYFHRTGVFDGDIPLIALGWSKACKCDTFTKKRGRAIATKRAEKATNVLRRGDMNVDSSYLRLEDIKSIESLPYVIKNNISYYINTAKDNLGIDGDAIFVVPVNEKFVDIAYALKIAIVDDSGFVDTNKAKSTTRTRYVFLR